MAAPIAPYRAERTALDVQIGGDHYKGKGIQPVTYIHANGLNFLEGCIVKRITRWRDKQGSTGSGLEDLLKIKHEVDLLIELEGLRDASQIQDRNHLHDSAVGNRR